MEKVSSIWIIRMHGKHTAAFVELLGLTIRLPGDADLFSNYRYYSAGRQ